MNSYVRVVLVVPNISAVGQKCVVAYVYYLWLVPTTLGLVQIQHRYSLVVNSLSLKLHFGTAHAEIIWKTCLLVFKLGDMAYMGGVVNQTFW